MPKKIKNTKNEKDEEENEELIQEQNEEKIKKDKKTPKKKDTTENKPKTKKKTKEEKKKENEENNEEEEDKWENEEKPNLDDKLVYFDTLYCKDYKTLFSSLESAFHDISFEFIKPDPKEIEKGNQSGGIRISDMTPDRVMYFRIFLPNGGEKSGFENFFCNFDSDTFRISFQIKQLHDFLKTIDRDGKLIFFIKKTNTSDLWFQFIDYHTNDPTTYIIRRIDADPPVELSTNQIESDLAVKMDTQEFYKVCKEVSSTNNDQMINIECCEDYIKFSSESQDRSVSMERIFNSKTNTRNLSNKNTKNVKISKSSENSNKPFLFKESYNAKYILYFNKCTSFCHKVVLGLTNKSPIFIKYSITTIGTMVICIANTVKKEYDEDRDDMENYMSDSSESSSDEDDDDGNSDGD